MPNQVRHGPLPESKPESHFEGIGSILGYPCTSGLEPDAIAAAAAIIRSDTALLRQLRRRVSDLKTRIDNLTTANMDILEGLRAVASEMP